MFATIGILAALRARDKLGIGQYVDISMTDGLVSWMSMAFGLYFGMGGSLAAIGMEPAYGVFQAKDKKYITLSIAHEDHFWRNLCHAIGKDELAELPREQRHQRREELVSMLQGVLATKTREEWLELLSKADVPCGPVYTLDEVVSDPQILHRGMIVEVDSPEGKVKQVAHPIKFSETPAQIRMLLPKLGEHTEEILTSLGYSLGEIDGLRKEGII
jgi:crotonobetainyl-CoA:carnitine CoA-transferase CaiB-like acyl-CoA transferase